jgi:hypothetical protein
MNIKITKIKYHWDNFFFKKTAGQRNLRLFIFFKYSKRTSLPLESKKIKHQFRDDLFTLVFFFC